MTGLRPSEALSGILSGRDDIEDAPQWLKSWAAFWIYKESCKVLSEINKERRRNKLNGVPENLRPHVEKECKRIWSTRK